jgi:nucleoside-diphosphate-sugar epimerase
MIGPGVGITGPGGYIGSNLSRHLARRGVSVHPLGRAQGIRVQEPGSLDQLPKQVSTLIHLAARTGVLESWSDPEEVHRFNFLATLEAVRLARVRGLRLVVLSSYPYGKSPALPTDEAQPAESMNPYSSSKALSEQLALDSARLLGFPVVSLRLFNVYGREPDGYHTLPAQIWQQIRSGGSRVEVQDALPRRDFLFIDDLCDALDRILDTAWTGSQVFNLGAGRCHSVADLVAAFGLALGRELQLVDLGQPRPGEIPATLCDNRRFAARFAWSPRTPLQEGLRSYLESPWA